ncbi:DUF2336 domain-containing protein [Roseospira marina]|uniref:DUF2336 domain-containing protein n=1 Tax=Roseospira marina TaxID=140057 RepID=A0A5M6IBT2_9PROT|nr:DUF2336 domain-containing protein [Roseospira marina]KAA5605572.1 DUF2336 domain-containing protein [Roseospira marina]MBB4313364.1 uncharacterized protein (DUF2336 family) [Roseospira marina]MBB5085895.1 uncharacterized protein (DUF2336 family) [Roseospira marina]
MSDLLRHLLLGEAGGALSYEEARALAAQDDVSVRRILAGRPDLPPEVLYFLARDPDTDVRRIIAGNANTPLKASIVLTEDGDTEVRLTLVERIARLAPGLTADERDQVRRDAHTVLARLARDEIPRVRALLSEHLKDCPSVLPDVINRLARDAELAVAAPVLTFSPVLTDDDLLDIIRRQPGSGALSAIARRPAGLRESVTDALAASDDITAIADMLANQGAQIREETLDRLIDRAGTLPDWHEPLVRRPRLPLGAAQRLAMFVSDTLVQALMLRRDLSPGEGMAVANNVRERLARAGGDGDGDVLNFSPGWYETLRLRHARVAEESAQGIPLEARLLMAMTAGKRTECIAVLAGMAGVSPAAVAAAVKVASPKGLAAMAWKAGLSADIGARLQHWLAGIPPEDVLAPDPATGDYALSTAEMAWQVEMFCEAEARGPS